MTPENSVQPDNPVDSVLRWESAMAHAREDWDDAAVAAQHRVAAWGGVITAMISEVATLKQEGKWVSGPADLMTIITRHRDELAHSSVVAWLLTPTGHHGLGTRLLRRILDAGWPPPTYVQPELNHVTVELERPGGERRADVVVDMGDVKLVIENKVDAAERDRQCEDLYLWASDTAPEVRFLLLSPLGRPPRSTSSQAAANAWRSLSYAGLAEAIRELIDEDHVTTAGSDAVRQYLRAISSISLARTPFVIHQGEGHVDT